jgi:RNA polymerase sigma factor (TIGR02999 family)
VSPEQRTIRPPPGEPTEDQPSTSQHEHWSARARAAPAVFRFPDVTPSVVEQPGLPLWHGGLQPTRRARRGEARIFAGCLRGRGRHRLASVSELTLILQRIEAGDASAAEQILPLVYGELRQLAAAKLAREAPGQTLQPTALVHEAWLRLGGDAQPSWQNRAHFFAAAAESMRRILVENARRKRALRHGGAYEKVSANVTGFDLAGPLPDDDLLLLDEALQNFAAHDARKSELIKQWCFVGLTLQEIAAAAGLTERTAQRDLAYAKAWLFGEIERLRR